MHCTCSLLFEVFEKSKEVTSSDHTRENTDVYHFRTARFSFCSFCERFITKFADYFISVYMFDGVLVGCAPGAAQEESRFAGRTALGQVRSGASEGRGIGAKSEVDEVGREVQV